MGEELKSTLDLVMERFKSSQPTAKLSDAQKREIAETRKRYEAKIAEVRILMAGQEELPKEIARLGREMEEKIEAVRGGKG